jgi:hypothetical protein
MNLSVFPGNWGEQWDWDDDPLNLSESGWWGMILSAMNWPTQKMLGASLLCILFLHRDAYQL